MGHGYHLCESGISPFPAFDESCHLKHEVYQSIYSQLADMFKNLLKSGIPVPLKRENVGVRLCKNANSDGSAILTCQVVYLYPTVIPKVDVEKDGNLFMPLLEECLESFASKGSILYNTLNPLTPSE